MQASIHAVPLLDGSKVYDVHLDQEGDNQTVILHCESEMAAHVLEINLNSGFVLSFAVQGSN